MNTEEKNKIIDAFRAWIPIGHRVSYTEIARAAGRSGFLVDPAIATEDVMAYIDSQTMNPNTTFYKFIDEVYKSSRWDQFIDQLTHYFSDGVYTKNVRPVEIPYNKYTIIRPIEAPALADKILNMLSSPTALSEDLVKAFVSFLIEYGNSWDHKRVNDILNREARTVLLLRLMIIPEDPEEIVRVIYYLITGSPMVVRTYNIPNLDDSSTRRDVDKYMEKLTYDDLIRLSKVWRRYRWLLLQLKFSGPWRINEIRRLSNKHHEPYDPGFWQSLTSFPAKEVMDRLPKELNKLDSPVRMTRILEFCKIRQQQNIQKTIRIFRIRNGKTWVDTDSIAPYPTYLRDVGVKVLTRLVDFFASKKRDFENILPPGVRPTYKLPENIELMCPTSEKNFIGPYPEGSYFIPGKKDNYVGIYWRDEWGTHDFDLSFVDLSGCKIGWDSCYTNYKDIAYSGDMVEADPEASEIIFFPNKILTGLVRVNRYNGDPGSKFIYYIGQDECMRGNLDEDYMINPNTVSVRVDMVSNKKEQVVSLIRKGKVYLIDGQTGDGRVSAFNEDLIKAFVIKAESHISIRSILDAAGFVEACDGDVPDIDLSDPTKEKILDLFS